MKWPKIVCDKWQNRKRLNIWQTKYKWSIRLHPICSLRRQRARRIIIIVLCSEMCVYSKVSINFWFVLFFNQPQTWRTQTMKKKSFMYSQACSWLRKWKENIFRDPFLLVSQWNQLRRIVSLYTLYKISLWGFVVTSDNLSEVNIFCDLF